MISTCLGRYFTSAQRTCRREVCVDFAHQHQSLALTGSVANILQKQTGWDLVSKFRGLGQLIYPCSNGVKLRSLQIAALRPGNLLIGRASSRLSADDIAEGHSLVRQRDAGRALRGPTAAALARTGPSLPAQELIVNRKFRATDRGWCIAKAQINVNPSQALGIESAAAADVDDVGAKFDQRSVENRYR